MNKLGPQEAENKNNTLGGFNDLALALLIPCWSLAPAAALAARIPCVPWPILN